MTQSETGDDAPGTQKVRRSLAMRSERLLKDADRLLKGDTDASAHELATLHLEQAKVLALLQLAETLRTSRTG